MHADRDLSECGKFRKPTRLLNALQEKAVDSPKTGWFMEEEYLSLHLMHLYSPAGARWMPCNCSQSVPYSASNSSNQNCCPAKGAIISVNSQVAWTRKVFELMAPAQNLRCAAARRPKLATRALHGGYYRLHPVAQLRKPGVWTARSAHARNVTLPTDSEKTRRASDEICGGKA